jgi:small subunit ribosomal protein S6
MALAPPTYDLMVLLDPTVPDEQRAQILADAERLIAQNGATLVNKQDWGARTMAYEIKHKTTAEYHLFQFQGPADALRALDRTLRITDGVIRHRIIKLAPGTPPAPEVRPETARPVEEPAAV